MLAKLNFPVQTYQPINYQCPHGIFRRSLCLSLGTGAVRKERHWELGNLPMVLLLCLRWLSKISDKLGIHQTVQWEHMIGPCFPLYTAWTTIPNEIEIWPDSEMNSKAQMPGQKRAENHTVYARRK